MERMRNHIQTVVGRYKGKVTSWDVVNEAIGDTDSDLTSWSRYMPDERLDWPLLFDEEYQPKYAFWAAVSF